MLAKVGVDRAEGSRSGPAHARRTGDARPAARFDLGERRVAVHHVPTAGAAPGYAEDGHTIRRRRRRRATVRRPRPVHGWSATRRPDGRRRQPVHACGRLGRLHGGAANPDARRGSADPRSGKRDGGRADPGTPPHQSGCTDNGSLTTPPCSESAAIALDPGSRDPSPPTHRTGRTPGNHEGKIAAGSCRRRGPTWGGGAGRGGGGVQKEFRLGAGGPGPFPVRRAGRRSRRERQATSRSFCESASARSFFRLWFSIWRIRSRVTLNARPTSSSVRGCSPFSP